MGNTQGLGRCHPRCPDHARGRDERRGLAVVELAICLPILVLLLLSTIEACVMLQLKQNLTVTAFEGARIGILPGSDATGVQLQCKMLLDDRNIEAYSIIMDPDPATMVAGDIFSVTVSADCAVNSVIGGIFYDGKTLSETVVMRAE